MDRRRSKLLLAVAVLAFAAVASAQSELQRRTLVVNGQSGDVIIYRIDGKAFIALEELVRIGQGSLSFQGNEIILTLPVSPAVAAPPQTPVVDPGMSTEFMRAAVQDLAIIKDWHTTLALAIQRGVPGDGSRLSVFHDRAAEGLRLATVAASSSSDQQALQLLGNHFTQVERWTRKLVQERKSMSTANYSVTPNALESDAQYQQIASCSKFLGTMLVGVRYEDDASCHLGHWHF
jgi:hypothetical protein